MELGPEVGSSMGAVRAPSLRRIRCVRSPACCRASLLRRAPAALPAAQAAGRTAARAPSSRHGRAARRRRSRTAPIEVGMKFRSDAGRLHHRAALLQAGEQHRHARRAPVVGERPAARRGDVRRRDRVRLAGGRRCRRRSPITRRHDLRRLVPLAAGPLRASAPATSPSGVGRGAAARAPRRRRQRRLPLRRRAAFPTETWNATNYWVDAIFSHDAARRTPARRRSASITPGRRRDRRRRPTTSRPSRFDEPMDPATRHRGSTSR